jgi:asparagine synthase (glutamine-hydrolysing)
MVSDENPCVRGGEIVAMITTGWVRQRWRRGAVACGRGVAMCGICGATRPGGDSILAAMNDRMTHRGPDDSGLFVDADGIAGLGVRRLRVIDLEGGHQPISNEDGSIWTVLNGEIYNFRALRAQLISKGHRFTTQSDTEVLVHLYEESGEELVHELDGMFGFAIWDVRRGRLLLARDRFGEKPLFYADDDREFVFASEVTALLAGMKRRPEIAPGAVDAFFVYGYIPHPQTIFSSIRQLPPGHLLVRDAKSGSTALSAYWEPSLCEGQTNGRARRLEDHAFELLEEAVSSRLIADVPLGVFLSGGLDSTLVAAIAARRVSGRLKTFTVDYDVGAVGEGAAARAAAARIGSEHHELLLTVEDVRARVPGFLSALDQPIADPALVALRALSEFARSEVTVALGGEGADELFGGYPRYRWLARTAPIQGHLARIPATVSGHLGRVAPFARAGRLTHALAPGSTFDRHLAWVTSNRASLRIGLYGERLMETLDSDIARAVAAPASAERSAIVGSLMRLDQMHWLPDDVLAKADRATMGASLEMRAPYLGRALAEFAASVPASIHLRGGGKSLLRSALARAMPGPGTGRKTAFRTPMSEWLRGPLAEVLARQLDESPLYRDGWFRRSTVARWAESHWSGREDRSQALWPAFVLGCWANEDRM